MQAWRSLTRGRRLVLLAGMCCLAAVALLMSVGAPGRSSPAPVPSAARAFTLAALGRPGQRVSLSQYAGRPLIINFFASWCGPCKKETPLLARFYRGHHGRVAVVGIDVNDATAAALRFIRAAGVSYPVGSDASAATAVRYGVAGVGIPQTFFLDAGHRIVKRVFGPVTLPALEAGLARMR